MRTEPVIISTTPTITQVAAKGICVGYRACEVAMDGRIPVRRRLLLDLFRSDRAALTRRAVGASGQTEAGEA